MIAGPVSQGLAVVPLALDTFAIAAVVGASRPTGWTRARISMIFVLFEGGMPLVGLALGASLGQAIGTFADYASGALLLALAGYLHWADTHDNDDEDDDDGAEGEAAKARRLNTARGLALLGLGLSISLDELAIGFSVGLGAQPVPTQLATLITVILIQTLLASQLALCLGSRTSPRLRERIEALTSPGLAILGGYQLTHQLLPTGILTPPTIVIPTVVLGIVILSVVVGIVILTLSHARRGTSPTAAPQTSGEPSAIASEWLTIPAPNTALPDPDIPSPDPPARPPLGQPRPAPAEMASNLAPRPRSWSA